MVDDIATEANRLKQLAGQELKEFLINKFKNLVEENIILGFKVDQNFNHEGYSYQKQYLANFIIETLDNKFIIINSSNSYRHDRMKLQSYDVEGVTNNASISDHIIASILLFPDAQLANRPLINFRNKVDSKEAYSPATHILVISELVQFLENHRDFVEEERAREELEEQQPVVEVKDGSYYGLRGNAFEKEVVAELNDRKLLQQLIGNGVSESIIFNNIIEKLCLDNSISFNELLNINATNTVLKLKSGGTAKTDIVVTLQAITQEVTETISVKNTTQSRVSCHDYKSDDFIRVLNVEGSSLAEYLIIYQQSGSHDSFIKNLPEGKNLEDFIQQLEPYKNTLLEWALTGQHDHQNLIIPEQQVSKYLLINKLGEIKFIDFSSYIPELYDRAKLLYGLPLSWTYPSKQRGARIQLKLPILL
jgi:restriction endonuclease MspI